jgi:hypothetical protein
MGKEKSQLFTIYQLISCYFNEIIQPILYDEWQVTFQGAQGLNFRAESRSLDFFDLVARLIFRAIIILEKRETLVSILENALWDYGRGIHAKSNKV